MTVVATFLMSVINMTTPLLLAATGITFSSKAGIINIGAEGMMLTGALFGVLGSYISGSALVGAMIAMLSGLILSAFFGIATIHGGSPSNVAGLSLNMIATGITIVVNRVVFGISGTVTKISGFDPVAIPLLSKIPYIGRAIFNQPLICHLAFLAVPVASFVMYRTSLGLKIRAVGESPKVCDISGINVYRIRWGALLFSGLMCGLGGAYMSMGSLNFFSENMIAGEGFMVLAAVTLGNWSPPGVLGSCLLFGSANAIRYRMIASGSSMPYQFWTSFPYLITILAVSGMFKKPRRGPASMGVPYFKE